MTLIKLVSPDGKQRLWAEPGSTGEKHCVSRGFLPEAEYEANKPKPKKPAKAAEVENDEDSEA